MRKTILFLLCFVLFGFFGFNIACNDSSSTSTPTVADNSWDSWGNNKFLVTYDGNGNTGGTAPVDATKYKRNANATILGPGSLVKEDFLFKCWNTEANGSGTDIYPASILVIPSNVTLYAKWSPILRVFYDGNENTGGTVPEDPTEYIEGQTATVLNNPGNLTKDGFTFGCWNTEPDGSGTPYGCNDTFVMGDEDVVLYAQWITPEEGEVHYDGAFATPVGIPTGATWTVLGRFTILQLAPHIGMPLWGVRVYNALSYDKNFTLRIYGPGTSTSPGPRLLNGTYNTTPGWNTLYLPAGFITIVCGDMWVGYQVSNLVNEYPVGCDAGPSIGDGFWWRSIEEGPWTSDLRWNANIRLEIGYPGL